jgi:hypothetical protein
MYLRPTPSDRDTAALTSLIEEGMAESEAINLFRSIHTVRRGKWVLRDPLAEVIKKEGQDWVLYSHDGKRLYKSPSKKKVEKREQQINYFKHADTETKENNMSEKQTETEKEKPAEVKEYAPWGVYTFKDLLTMRESEDRAEQVEELTEDFTGLLRNIVNDPTVENKYNSMTDLWNEFSQIMQNVLVTPAIGTTEKTQETAVSESLMESDGSIVSGEFNEVKASPMYMDVKIIKPGWGNTRDNHYYPKEMLARDAIRFQGAKMYETDHREKEKSTRTWVSTIEKIARFDEDGSPIARVVVHDTDFAQRVANLKAGGMLEKMECSISAQGTSKPGYEEGGRKGSIIESITDVSSVDWVTRAGAGGMALDIEESAATPAQDTSPEKPPVETKETQPISEPILESGAAGAILEASRLPAASRARLSSRKWRDANELTAAVEQEIMYVKELTGSGKPTLLGETKRPVVDDAEIDRRKNELIRKATGG